MTQTPTQRPKDAPNIFPGQVIEDARVHALACFPNESVGFVIDGMYVPQENVSKTPRNHFVVADKAVADAYLSGTFEGVIHSHTDGAAFPSVMDMAYQIATAMPWGVVVLSRRGQVKDYFELGNHTLEAPLEGCLWRPAIHDCFGMVRRYWWQRNRTLLPDIPRTDNWWEVDTGEFYRVHRPIFDHFEEVANFDLCPGDVILFAIGGPDPNHFAIYEGDNVILHHMTNCLSARRPLNTLSAKIFKVFRLQPAAIPEV